MEYDLESELKQGLTAVSAVFIIGIVFGLKGLGSAHNGEHSMGNGLLLMVSLLGAALPNYLRSQLDDVLVFEDPTLSVVRRFRGRTTRLQSWSKSDVAEIACSQSLDAADVVDSSQFVQGATLGASTSSQKQPTVRVLLLLRDGKHLDLNCASLSQAQVLAAQLQQETGAVLRSDLPPGPMVPCKRGGKWTFRGRNLSDSALVIAVALIFIIIGFCFLLGGPGIFYYGLTGKQW
jgi:hypothetical protein